MDTMKLRLMTYVSVLTVLVGFIAGYAHKSSKLYFSGDGGSTDFQIVFKYMLMTVIFSGVALLVVYRHKVTSASLKSNLRFMTALSLTSLITVVIGGAIVTRAFQHTACDEFGQQSAACQNHPSPWFYP